MPTNEELEAIKLMCKYAEKVSEYIQRVEKEKQKNRENVKKYMRKRRETDPDYGHYKNKKGE